MATKTWKIGEYCKGGIITVKTSGTNIIVIGKDWDHSKGTHRGSNQTGAKEWTRLEVPIGNRNSYRELDTFLNDLTTSWWTEQVIDWIVSKTSLDKSFF